MRSAFPCSAPCDGGEGSCGSLVTAVQWCSPRAQRSTAHDQRYIEMADDCRTRGPPPPPGTQISSWEKIKFTTGNIDLALFWYTNFWVPDPLSSNTSLPTTFATPGNRLQLSAIPDNLQSATVNNRQQPSTNHQRHPQPNRPRPSLLPCVVLGR